MALFKEKKGLIQLISVKKRHLSLFVSVYWSKCPYQESVLKLKGSFSCFVLDKINRNLTSLGTNWHAQGVPHKSFIGWTLSILDEWADRQMNPTSSDSSSTSAASTSVHYRPQPCTGLLFKSHLLGYYVTQAVPNTECVNAVNLLYWYK